MSPYRTITFLQHKKECDPHTQVPQVVVTEWGIPLPHLLGLELICGESQLGPAGTIVKQPDMLTLYFSVGIVTVTHTDLRGLYAKLVLGKTDPANSSFIPIRENSAGTGYKISDLM